jgi:dihydroorotate dehydrogenase electron transfer subunit
MRALLSKVGPAENFPCCSTELPAGYARGLVLEARLAAKLVLELKLRVDTCTPEPGQFVMLWVPRVGEVPMSIADFEEGVLTMYITRRGKVTGYLHDNARAGFKLFVRGPYGRGFSAIERGRALLVGGGTGSAPLHFLAKRLRSKGVDCVAVLGFKSADHAILLGEMSKLCRVEVATDDGSLGFSGPAHELAAKLLSEERFDIVYVCGPEPMIAAVLELARSNGVPLEASLERYMRCAVGVCGSCVLEPLGLRVCRDGPVFSGNVLFRVEDLGRWWRDADGRRIPLR